ncbi:MAG: hypothetical protein WA117_23830 [Verrucomicrobiia bacterium]
MNKRKTQFVEMDRWWVVVLFAVAMAWVESAAVLYLRTLIGRIDPYQPNPLPSFGGFAMAEAIREVATMIMLAGAGWLAGRGWRARFGYFVIAFGVWDIFYYVFLRPLTGWPKGLLDWDVLFLIPLPWWGPVVAPCLVAGLMILFGTLVTQFACASGTPWPRRTSAIVCVIGMALALYVFMADAIRVVHQGEAALRQMLPTHFNWPLFSVALLLMAMPILDVARQIVGSRKTSEAEA